MEQKDKIKSDNQWSGLEFELNLNFLSFLRAIFALRLKKNRRLYLVCFLTFAAILCCIGGAAAQYRIDQWTADDGLPQNSVYGIVQTDEGYLWLATLDGLARFDGVRFTVFNKSNSPGIINNRFTSLFKDARGDLWAGTEESGIVRYHDGRFSHYRVSEGQVINSISSDANGNPVISTSETTAVHFTGEEFSPFNPQTGFSESDRVVPRQNVRLHCNFFTDQNYGSCYTNGHKLSFSPTEGVDADKLRAAAQDKDGNFWLVNDKNELVRVENGKVVRVYNEADGLPKIPLDFVTGAKFSLFSWDGKDSLFLTDLATMRNELLFKISADTPNETGDIYPPYASGESALQSAYQDEEGNLWFGTLRAGLFRARKQTVKTFSTAEGLTDNNVYPIFENDDGSLLVGTTGGVFNLNNGRFTPVESPKSVIHAFGKDSTGRIVFSSFGELFVREGNRSVPFLRGVIPSERTILEGRTIYAIHSDRENALWLGVDDGLTRFKDGNLTTYTTDNGLAGNDVKVIIDAQAGGLWIGTYGGLSRFQDGKLTSWTESEGLPSRTIRALYEDADETLWIGTYDGGLSRFKDGKFTHYDTKIGLYNDGAFQILEDENRNFWISSNHGIYRVSKDELNEYADGKRQTITSTAYGKSDGMLNAESNGGSSPAGIKTRDGRLWFPTQDGVAMIDPKEIKTNSQQPPVVIEKIKIDNNISEFDREKSQINIEPSQQNFEIGYTALSFINSENLQFKYKLEGLDDDWIDAGTRRLAYYSHVPPGNYTFRVIAANSDGVWNKQGATLKIVVLPPFYRTWWFLILASFVIAATAYLLFRRRVSQINLKHASELAFSRRLIDSQEQERKRFAAEMHDGLGQSLVIIKNRARLSLRQSDEKEAMLDHLENISDTASHAIEEAREIAFNLRPHLLDRLGLTKTIESMLGKVFGASGIEFEAKIDQIDDVLANDSEILLYRIVQECANNIVKHSNAEKAIVIIKCDEKNLTVKISDNGRGFDAATNGNDLSKRSFGLVGIAERTRLLGGKLNIESKPGNGTNVTINITGKENVAREIHEKH